VYKIPKNPSPKYQPRSLQLNSTELVTLNSLLELSRYQYNHCEGE